jgi:hypothetical protein
VKLPRSALLCFALLCSALLSGAWRRPVRAEAREGGVSVRSSAAISRRRWARQGGAWVMT